MDEITKDESLERELGNTKASGFMFVQRRRRSQSSGQETRVRWARQDVGARRMECQQGDGLPVSRFLGDESPSS